MKETDALALTAWLAERGLAGDSETDLLRGLCEGCVRAGLPITSAQVLIDTLHPVYEGRAFRWREGDAPLRPEVEYGPSDEGESAVRWRQSPLYVLRESGETELRRRIVPGAPPEFPLFERLARSGVTEYLALIHRFAGEGAIGGMDCVYSSWATKREGGYREDDVAALRRLSPHLALALKCTSLARIAGTLVEVYLGEDAGRRVLSGRISRGVAERIPAVLWFSDLRGFTSIADEAPPHEVIPLLNDYADTVISAIREERGEVLKLIGDGVLAIFRADDPPAACRAALRAEARMRRAVEVTSARRASGGRPTTSVYLGLHVGEVFYGNIGSPDRLDFTVVGPAVNEASRVAAMCRSADRAVLVSSDFRAATPEPERSRLVSVGRYALRGIRRAQELFTLEETA
jgi:adenylate cyclase